jgi:hypothetical protein
MPIQIAALDTDIVLHLKAGGPDANGHAPERHISAGGATPCRHCMNRIAEGEPYLLLAHRPFPAPQPYAEQGPIFLHAEPCARYADQGGIPPMLTSAQYMLRGYDADNRIVYGSGQIVPTAEIRARAAAMLDDPRIVYVHLRSASNNCYLGRIERV